MNKYREGEDEDIIDAQTVPPPATEADYSFNSAQEDATILTAFLVVEYSDGRVLPVTDIEGLEMQHTSTPHNILRNCADVVDQISGVRVIGEVLQHVKTMLESQQANTTEILKSYLSAKQPMVEDQSSGIKVKIK